MFKMADCPGQVCTYSVVDPDISVWSTFAAYLRIEIIQSRSEEWKDIEAPVHPTGESLPLL